MYKQDVASNNLHRLICHKIQPDPKSKLKNSVYLTIYLGSSGGVMASKLGKQTFLSEFVYHWVPHSYGLVPHLNKPFSKLLPNYLPTAIG